MAACPSGRGGQAGKEGGGATFGRELMAGGMILTCQALNRAGCRGGGRKEEPLSEQEGLVRLKDSLAGGSSETSESDLYSPLQEVLQDCSCRLATKFFFFFAWNSMINLFLGKLP